MKHALIYILTFCNLFLLNPISQAAPEPPNQPDDQLLSLVLSLKTDVTCFGGNNGLAVVAAVGGLPPYVFVWSNGTLGPINANLSANVYTLTVTDLLGATASMNVTINEPPQLLVDVTAEVDINCLNATGSATVATSGGTGSSSVLWSNGQIGLSIANLTAGVYIATATDDNGCISTETVNIEADLDLPAININLSGDLQVDCGTPLVSLDATASAGGSGITYLWTTLNGHIVAGSSSNLATVDAAGNYQLLITNGNNGCTSTQSVNVSANLSLPAVNIQVGAGVDLQIDCLTPEITLNGTGSATGAGILYLWTTLDGHIVAGATTLDHVVVDAAGTYTLQVTNNNNGCTDSENVTVNVDIDLPLVDIAAGLGVDLQIDCLSPQITLDASASASGSGISYLWTTLDGHILAGLHSNIATVDAAGTYLLSISDSNNGCNASASVQVTAEVQLPSIVVDLSAQLGCNNSSLVLDASASSQGGNFLYLWTTLDGHIVLGANTLTPTINASGSYTLLITNTLSGCTAQATVVVTGQPTLNISLSGVVHVSCFGLLNGAATINVSGGILPYTYLWSNGMTTASVSGLAAGNYLATITDAQGCKGEISVSINQPDQMTTTVNTTPASAAGATDGSASISVTGGVGPYTYLWSNGMTGSSAANLAAGTYSVTITDATNCQIVIHIVIGNMAGCTLGINVTTTAADCNQSNGQATATAVNASGQVTYAWSNGMNTGIISSLAAGTYIVTITDAQGCTAVGAAIIGSQDNVPPVVITQNISLVLDATCNASLTVNMINNGSFDACGPITLSLNLNVFDGDDLGNQTVVLTATDQAGHTASATAVVTIVDDTPSELVCPADIVISTGSGAVVYDAPFLQDNCTIPSATIVLTSGFASGSIFPGGTTEMTFVALGAGGFAATCNFTVTVSGGLVVTFDLDSPSCPGSSDGSITVNIAGGVGNYSYFWLNANGQTTQTATGLSAGPYTVIIVDGAGNVTIQSVLLPDPSPLSVSLMLLMDNCDNTGSIDVTVTGGTPPYSYEWFDAGGNLFATTEDLDSIPSGDYTLVVTDANGCTFNSGIVTVNLSTGVAEYEFDSAGKIALSPNPSPDGQIILDFNFPEISAVQVEIFSSNGQQIGTARTLGNIQKAQIPFNLNVTTPGQYWLKFTTDQHTYSKKVILLN